MAKLIFEAILWGLASGIVGATYRGILADEETFNFWWKFGARFERRFFFKPLWGCGHCAAGQFALWTYLLLKIVPAMTAGSYFRRSADGAWVYIAGALMALFALIIAISTAILAAKLIGSLLNHLQ
jgi:hypothetical protein